MKTAVSVPDEVFQRGEEFAKQARISRSQLYARALDAYLRSQEDAMLQQSYDQIAQATAASVEGVGSGDMPGEAGLLAGRDLIDQGAWQW